MDHTQGAGHIGAASAGCDRHSRRPASARTGGTERARELLAPLGSPESYGVPRAWTYFHLFKGEIKEALEWREKMVGQRDSAALIMARLPYGEPRSRETTAGPRAAKRMNLPGAI